MKYVAEEKITIFVHLKKIVPVSQFQVELIKLEARAFSLSCLQARFRSWPVLTLKRTTNK